MSKSRKDTRVEREDRSSMDSLSTQKSKKGNRRRVNQVLSNIRSSRDIEDDDFDLEDYDIDDNE